MKSRYIYTPQDIVDTMNESMSFIVSRFKSQSKFNMIMCINLYLNLLLHVLHYRKIMSLKKEVEELKRPEGE